MFSGNVGVAGGLREKGAGIQGKRMFLESETSQTSQPDASYEKQTPLIVLIWHLKQNSLRGGGDICWSFSQTPHVYTSVPLQYCSSES